MLAHFRHAAMLCTVAPWRSLNVGSREACGDVKAEPMAKKPEMVHPKEAERFMTDCFRAAGVNEKNSRAMSKVLVTADILGNWSHGMNRLDSYLTALDSKLIAADATPNVITETACSAYVDGHNALGVVVGNYCMDLAIKKAKREGICFITATNSNNFGVCLYYIQQATDEGLVAMTMTNTLPHLVPTGAKVPRLGMNPIAFGASATGSDRLLVDTTTTMVSMEQVEMKRAKRQPVPLGWAQGPDGKLTTDAEVAAKTAALRPLGGGEESGGHKGYALACLVDILCGVLSGSNYSTQIKCTGKGGKGGKLQKAKAKPANIGQIFIVINPKFFGPAFHESMDTFLHILRNCCPLDREKPVLVAGDLEKIRMREVETSGGVLYPASQLETCKVLSDKYKVPPIQTVDADQKNDNAEKC